jgi:predicted transcriptional regulator
MAGAVAGCGQEPATFIAFMLCAKFLNIVLAEIPLTGCVELLDHLVRLGLADRDQRDFLR